MNALVLGGASCVWEDVEALEDMLGREWDGLVIAANDIGCHWPRHLDHWCSLHPQKMRDWFKLRAEQGHPNGYVTWSSRKHNFVDRVAPRTWRGGASGLLAVSVARQLEVTRCVLAGVPMTRTPHFAESTVHVDNRPWSSAATHWKTWKAAMHDLQGWVRSMSGQTEEHLGRPTVEWLNGEG